MDDGKREWQPVKYTVTPGPDMRNSKLGPRGYKAKRKREIAEELEQHLEETADMMEDAPAEPQVPSAKRQRVEGAPFRATSGKVWKIASARATAYKQPVLGSSWEKKMQDKATRKAFREIKAATVDAVKEKKKEAARRKQQALDRKKANQAKSALVTAVSTATAKRLMKHKKQRKLLKTADTN